jgi:hypothetical protein
LLIKGFATFKEILNQDELESNFFTPPELSKLSKDRSDFDFSVDIYSSILTFYLLLNKGIDTSICLGEKMYKDKFILNNYLNKTNIVNKL